jgi:recombination protein RecA
MNTTDRTKTIEAAISNIQRQFGQGAIMRFSDDSVDRTVEVIPTGSLTLDLALGIGGLPRGRIIEIYGPEASGKTTLTLHAIAECQKAGGVAAFIDAEHAIDINYAQNLGIKVSDLLLAQPDSGEQALEIAETLARSAAVDIIVVDSVAALTPRSEIEGDMTSMQPGTQARLMSKAMRKLTSAIHKSNCTVIFINQLRHKIGVMFGSPETTSGGNALKFYASVRLDIRRIGSIKKGDEVLGNRTRVKVVKNKLAPPFRQAEFEILYGQGFNRTGELIDLGLEAGIFKRSGSWYSYGDDRIGQGRQNALEYLEQNPDIAATVEQAIRASSGLIAAAGDDSDDYAVAAK